MSKQPTTEDVLDLKVQATSASYAARTSKNQKREAVYNKQPTVSKQRPKEISNSQKLLKISAVMPEATSPAPIHAPHTGSAFEEDVEQSPPITAPMTVDTDFLPGLKQSKAKGTVQPLINLREATGPAHSNIISKEHIGQMVAASKADKLINKSVSNNERLQPINTGTHDDFKESTDLDQVHQRHFNEYFATRTKTPQKDDRDMDNSPQTEVRSANISNQDSLNKLPSPTGSQSPLASNEPSRRQTRDGGAQTRPVLQVAPIWQEPQFSGGASR